MISSGAPRFGIITPSLVYLRLVSYYTGKGINARVEKMNYLLTKFAAEYNCNAYGSDAYNSGGTCVAGGTGTSSGDPNLANTGVDVLVPLVIGLVLIAAAIVMIVRNVRRKKSRA